MVNLEDDQADVTNVNVSIYHDDPMVYGTAYDIHYCFKRKSIIRGNIKNSHSEFYRLFYKKVFPIAERKARPPGRRISQPPETLYGSPGRIFIQ